MTKVTVGCTVPKYGTRSHPRSLPGHYRPRLQTPTTEALVSRYDIPHVDIYRSARKHGVTDADIVHALGHALGAAEQDDGKVIYLGADRAGNMLEVVSVIRDDDTEVVIHAMRMRRIYEPLLREMRGTDD